MDPPVPITHPCQCQLPDPLAQWPMRCLAAGISACPLDSRNTRQACRSLTRYAPEDRAPLACAATRSPLSTVDVLQHCLVQTQLRHQLLQTLILLPQLLELPHLVRLKTTVPLLPAVECRFRYTQFTTDIADRCTPFMSLDCGYNLLHRITLACPIDLLPFTGNHHAILANALD